MLRTSGDWFADFEQLQDRLDEMLRGRGAASSIRAVSRTGAFPALNVGTWADGLEIYAFAPGIDPSTVDVSVEKGLLVLSGKRDDAARPKEGKAIYANERFGGRFRRVVALPEDADPGRVEATYRDGVLKVVVAKRESSKPRQIRVQNAA